MPTNLSRLLKVIAIESSRHEASMGGDLRELIGADHGQVVYVTAANGNLVQDTINKVNLSTARLSEFAVNKGLAAGFIFLPMSALTRLGIKSGDAVSISLEMPTAATGTTAPDDDADEEPETKAGKILAVVKQLPIGTKVKADIIIEGVRIRFGEEVDGERVRSVLINSELVSVAKSALGRGNTYERVR